MTSSGDEPSGLFRRPRRPVELPTEHRETRTRTRSLVTMMAVGALLVGIVLGIVYQRFWAGASTEITRLLPASTQVYLRGRAPWDRLKRTMTLDRWRDSEALQIDAETRGLFAAAAPGRAVGIPMRLVRRLLRVTEHVQLAVVPTTRGMSVLAFAEFADPLERRRVLSLLGPLTETVDRQLGFDISRVRQSVGAWPGREPEVPVHVVAMDPYVVFSFGPLDALSDVLQAKVSGLSRPIRRRAGFEASEQHATGDAFWVYIDPANLYETLSRSLPDVVEDSALQRALLVDSVQAVGVHARVSERDDVLELVADVSEPDTLASLGEVFPSGRHELLELAPAEARYILALALPDPIRSLGALRDLLAQLEDELDRSVVFSGLLDSGRARQALETSLRLGAELFNFYAGETMLVGMPREGADLERWALVSRVRDPALVEDALARLSPLVLGKRMAYGMVRQGESALHIVRPASAEPLLPDEVLAWRLRGSLLEVAPRASILLELEQIQQDEQTLAGTGLLERTLRSAPEESVAALVLHPSVLARAAGRFGARLTADLADDYRYLATVAFEENTLKLRSNLGLWTIAASLAAAEPAELDRLLLADLPETCLEALTALCAAHPRSLPCQPLMPGRSALTADACRRAFGQAGR